MLCNLEGLYYTNPDIPPEILTFSLGINDHIDLTRGVVRHHTSYLRTGGSLNLAASDTHTNCDLLRYVGEWCPGDDQHNPSVGRTLGWVNVGDPWLNRIVVCETVVERILTARLWWDDNIEHTPWLWASGAFNNRRFHWFSCTINSTNCYWKTWTCPKTKTYIKGDWLATTVIPLHSFQIYVQPCNTDSFLCANFSLTYIFSESLKKYRVQIWLPLPLPLTGLVRIWLVNRIYQTHLIG